MENKSGTPQELIEANDTWVGTKTVNAAQLKRRPMNNDTVLFHNYQPLTENNKENTEMMQLNLSIFCHVLGQSALIDEAGEELNFITLNCPNFKVVDFGSGEQDDSAEEVERDSVLLSAALLSLPARYRANFDGHRLEVEELPGKMIEVQVFDKESKSGYEHLGMTSEFLRTTITIAYVENE